MVSNVRERPVMDRENKVKMRSLVLLNRLEGKVASISKIRDSGVSVYRLSNLIS